MLNERLPPESFGSIGETPYTLNISTCYLVHSAPALKPMDCWFSLENITLERGSLLFCCVLLILKDHWVLVPTITGINTGLQWFHLFYHFAGLVIIDVCCVIDKTEKCNILCVEFKVQKKTVFKGKVLWCYFYSSSHLIKVRNYFIFF